MNRNDSMLYLRVVITLMKNKMALYKLRASAEAAYNNKYNYLQSYILQKPHLREVHTYECWNIFQLNAKKEKERQIYNAEIKEYNAKKAELNAEIEQLDKNYAAIINSIDMEYNKTSELLNKYYNIGIINPNYFKLPALCKFYEYYSKELVDTFREAYRHYEEDKKYYHLMDKLQNILNSIDSVRDTQRELYNVLVKMNENIEDACDTLESILHSAQAIQRNTQRIILQNALNSFSVSSINNNLIDLNNKLFY